LAFRPNPESMLGKDDHEGDDDASSSDNEMVKDSDDNSGSSDEEEDDEELMAARAALNAGRSKKKSYNQDNDDEVERRTGVSGHPALQQRTSWKRRKKQTMKNACSRNNVIGCENLKSYQQSKQPLGMLQKRMTFPVAQHWVSNERLLADLIKERRRRRNMRMLQ
jgi:hypothetical protein